MTHEGLTRKGEEKGIHIIEEDITPVEAAHKHLKRNQYYALMVEDNEYKGKRPKSDYVNYEKSWIGLERTGGKVYVSKDYNERHEPYRGSTVLVSIDKDADVYVLKSKLASKDKRIREHA